MTLEEEFLHAIIENPDDDAPRLRYASWLDGQGDPRGEFIRIQCAIARYEREDPYNPFLPQPHLRRRQEELLHFNRDRWMAPVSNLHLGQESFEFRRGMIEEVICEDRYLVEYGAELESSALPLLSRLTLVGTGEVSLGEVVNLPCLATFRWLNFEQYELDDEGVELLCRSSAISHVKGLRFGFDPTSVVEKERFRSEGWLLGKRSAAALATTDYLRNLEYLWLPVTDIGDDGIHELAGSRWLRGLVVLDCSLGEISSEGVRSLALSDNCASLRSLGLAHNKRVSAAGAELIARSSHLRELRVLNIEQTDLGDEGVAHIASSPMVTRLRSLYLGRNHITARGAEFIASSTSLSDLNILELTSNRLGSRGAFALAASPTLAQLWRLSLDKNLIGDEGITAMLNVFHLPRLTHLSLYDNGIGDAGALAISSSPALSTLEVLNLGWNPITNKGAVALLDSPFLEKISWIGLRTDKFDSATRLRIRQRFGY
jgi:uncharacterized protein (TIGR02996 family)